MQRWGGARHCECASFHLLTQACTPSPDRKRHQTLATLAETSQVDLLILCHTLSAAERHTATALSHGLWPAAKILTLSASHSLSVDGAVELIHISDGPQALVDRSRQLTA